MITDAGFTLFITIRGKVPPPHQDRQYLPHQVFILLNSDDKIGLDMIFILDSTSTTSGSRSCQVSAVSTFSLVCSQLMLQSTFDFTNWHKLMTSDPISVKQRPKQNLNFNHHLGLKPSITTYFLRVCKINA